MKIDLSNSRNEKLTAMKSLQIQCTQFIPLIRKILENPAITEPDVRQDSLSLYL